MTDHDFENFYKLACERFGADKFTDKVITFTDETLRKFNADTNSSVTREDIESYRQVWLLKNVCPKCGSELGGIFGSFEWGIVHGCGYCSECKTSFQLYHYFGNSKTPVRAYALIGFS